MQLERLKAPVYCAKRVPQNLLPKQKITENPIVANQSLQLVM